MRPVTAFRTNRQRVEGLAVEHVEPPGPANDGLTTIAPRDDTPGDDTPGDDTPGDDEVEVLRLAIEPTFDAPGAARAHAARALDESPHADVVLALVSELVTNAVLHSGGGAELRIVRRRAHTTAGEVIRVEVRDNHRSPPERSDTPGAHGGFGLRIVSALARRWGYAPAASGKVVWFEVGGP
jgi:anti-sigma regulatory factor (Ser/Thr protein kinase)